MGYTIHITTHAVEVVSSAEQMPGIVAAKASGAKVGLRLKWGGGGLCAQPKSRKMVPQRSGWDLEDLSMLLYASYVNIPPTGGFPAAPASQGMQYPSAGSLYSHLIPLGSNPVLTNPSMETSHGAGIGLGFPSAPAVYTLLQI